MAERADADPIVDDLAALLCDSEPACGVTAAARVLEFLANAGRLLPDGGETRTTEALDATLHALVAEGFTLPYIARCQGYPDYDGLQAADVQACQDNREALRRALAGGSANVLRLRGNGVEVPDA